MKILQIENYLSKERDSAWIYLYLINDDYLRCYLLINLT